MRKILFSALLASLIFIQVSSAQVLQNFELVGRHFAEGFVSAAEMVGDTLYYNAGVMFEIVDLTFPQSPVWLGSFENNKTLQKLAVCNGRIVASAPDSRLHLIDISVPSNPQIIFSCLTPRGVEDIAIRGNIVFALVSDAILIYDNSYPDSLALLAQYVSENASFKSLIVVGDTAIACGGSHTFMFETIDISNLAGPQLIHTHRDLNIPALVSVAMEETNVYFGGGRSNFGKVATPIYHYDISNPLNPVLMDSTAERMRTYDLLIDDTLLFAACDTMGLRIYAIGQTGSLTFLGSTVGRTSTTAISKHGDRIICSDGYYGVKVVDVTDVTNPTIQFNHDVAGSITGVVVNENRLFISENFDSLRIFDISDTEHPVWQVGKCGAHYIDNLFYTDGMLVGTEMANWDGFGIFDVTDVTNPALISSSGGSDIITSIKINDGYLYTPCWCDNLCGYYCLKTYSIADPVSPTLADVITYQPQGSYFMGFDIEFLGNIAYVTDMMYNLTPILDISDPNNISIIGQIPYGGSGAKIYGKNLILAPGIWVNDIDILDVTVPQQPVHKYTVQGSMQASLIDVIDGYLWMGGYFDSRLQLMDIGGFLNPESLAAFSLPFWTDPELGWFNPQFAISGRTVYCADGDRGLYVLRYTGPMPINTGDANNSGAVNGVDVIYLVAYLKGVGNPPAEPQERGDANGDCAVNGLDVSYLVGYLKGLGDKPIRGLCFEP
jgi:hypothetical protein